MTDIKYGNVVIYHQTSFCMTNIKKSWNVVIYYQTSFCMTNIKKSWNIVYHLFYIINHRFVHLFIATKVKVTCLARCTIQHPRQPFRKPDVCHAIYREYPNTEVIDGLHFTMTPIDTYIILVFPRYYFLLLQARFTFNTSCRTLTAGLKL